MGRTLILVLCPLPWILEHLKGKASGPGKSVKMGDFSWTLLPLFSNSRFQLMPPYLSLGSGYNQGWGTRMPFGA